MGRTGRHAWVLASLAASLSASVGCRAARADDERVHGVGTVEIVEVDLAPMAGGRVERMLAREGETVRVGDTLVVLKRRATEPEIAGLRARAAAAEAGLRDLRAGARAPELARARAELAAVDAEAVRAARDVERLRPLAERGTVSAQQLDAARSLARNASARRDAAREALRQLEAGA